MTRPSLELADIVRAHGAAYRERHPLSPQQSKVLDRIVRCRTAAMGGHVERCTGCDFTRIAYNSCRDRPCPKCQAANQHAWVESRCEKLLDVPYFHVVFTLPHELNPLALQNPTAIYDLLFDAASATLRTLAADPKRLGAQIGVTAVLHTWGQNLLLHAAKWVVYAKAQFGGPTQVFRYLGRYTHRVASSNHRLRFLDEEHVTFTWKDYADDHRLKSMRLTAEDHFVTDSAIRSQSNRLRSSDGHSRHENRTVRV